jgi:hypothetical protein
MPYLDEDIYSTINPTRLYGTEGTWVEVMSDQGGILVVKPKDGLGFSVMKDQLRDTSLKATSALGGKKPPEAKGSSSKKSKSQNTSTTTPLPNQPSLF